MADAVFGFHLPGRELEESGMIAAFWLQAADAVLVMPDC